MRRPTHRILDAHTHSLFSDGKLAIEEISGIARRRGCDVGISDHAGTMYPLNSEAKIIAYLSGLDDYPVYKSLELNINEDFRNRRI